MLYWTLQYLKEERGVAGGGRRYQCMLHFARFQFLVDTNPAFFSDEVAGEVVQACRKGLICYQKLASADRKRDDDRRTYKITPKFHSMLELTFYIAESKRNPRSFDHIVKFFMCGKTMVSKAT